MDGRDAKGRFIVGNPGNPDAPGAPEHYRPEMALQAYKLCLLGYTNDELARFFAVGLRTIELWLSKHTDFAERVYAGRDIADAEVAHGLYKKAIAGDVPAAAKWLGARQRKRGWGQDPLVSVKADAVTINPGALSDAALEEVLAASDAATEAFEG